MALQIIINDDLTPVASLGADAWQSTGDDPAFELRFGFLRSPIIVAYLQSHDATLDPKAYVDYGSGYSERNAIALEPGQSFIVVADIGRMGLIRSFRIDPASCPCRFSFRVETYESREAAARAIEQRRSLDIGSTVHCDLGALPRFGIPTPRWRCQRSKADIDQYITAHYDLAKRLPPAQAFSDPVWLSTVVPVYNAPPRYLDDIVRSFEAQDVFGTELILSDDASTAEETRTWYETFRSRRNVRIVRGSVNSGIAGATNAGLAEASGTWITLLDHDDVIAPYAFKMIQRAINENPDAKFLYTDEVVVDDRLRPHGLMLKPAFDSVLLTGVNYINHFSVYRRERLQQIGYLRTGFDGSQDYDLLLRYLKDVPESQILHLPYPAYWWRRNGQTYSRRFIDAATSAARRAIAERFDRPAGSVMVEPALTDTLHKLNFAPPLAGWPKISIIIPSMDSPDLIGRVLEDLYTRTDYPNFEVIVVDNGTTEVSVRRLYRDYECTHANFTAILHEEAFNFARAINRGISRGTGKHYLILNNDVQVLEPSWIKEMVSCLHFDGTGIVGAKLLYPNQTLQHAGVIVGFGELAGHWYLNKPADHGGPFNRLHLRNSMSCVTGAVMLISGECARQVGVWDEKNFAVAYNDVDYCLRARKAGFRVVWTPYACLIHHESVSRGSDRTGERKRRFEREKESLRRIHGTDAFDDPAINPGYEKRHSTPGLEVPLAVATARQGFLARQDIAD